MTEFTIYLLPDPLFASFVCQPILSTSFWFCLNFCSQCFPCLLFPFVFLSFLLPLFYSRFLSISVYLSPTFIATCIRDNAFQMEWESSMKKLMRVGNPLLLRLAVRSFGSENTPRSLLIQRVYIKLDQSVYPHIPYQFLK